MNWESIDQPPFVSKSSVSIKTDWLFTVTKLHSKRKNIKIIFITQMFIFEKHITSQSSKTEIVTKLYSYLSQRIYVATTSDSFPIFILQIKNIFVITATTQSKKIFSVWLLIEYTLLKTKFIHHSFNNTFILLKAIVFGSFNINATKNSSDI